MEFTFSWHNDRVPPLALNGFCGTGRRSALQVSTNWRLLMFRLRRLRRLALVALVVLLVVLGSAGVWFRLTRQQFRLTIRFTDAEFVSAVAVQSSCCRLAATINLASPAATFLLPRGDYTISATPSSAGYQQHWYYAPGTVHLAGDRAIDVHGAYGHG